MSNVTKYLLLILVPLAFAACGDKKAESDANSGRQQVDNYNANLIWVGNHEGELSDPSNMTVAQLKEAISHEQAIVDSGNSALFYTRPGNNVSWDDDDKAKVHRGVARAERAVAELRAELKSRRG